MAIEKPYCRTCRPFIQNGYKGTSNDWFYILHENYANSPRHYIRAFLLIQKDLQNLIDFIEPSDTNFKCYSFRIHELLLRTCVEIEANCKAILVENGYNKSGNLNMIDYIKIDKTHHLSSYEIALPTWNGEDRIRKPFLSWKENNSPEWYQAYNSTKHNRHQDFHLANFRNLIDSVSGLTALLSSQFYVHDYTPIAFSLGAGSVRYDDMSTAIGDYFRVKFPDDWLEEEKYDFSWSIMASYPNNNPIEKFDYNSL